MFNFSDVYLNGIYVSMIVNFIFAIGYTRLYMSLDEVINFEQIMIINFVAGTIGSILWPIQIIGLAISFVVTLIYVCYGYIKSLINK